MPEPLAPPVNPKNAPRSPMPDFEQEWVQSLPKLEETPAQPDEKLVETPPEEPPAELPPDAPKEEPKAPEPVKEPAKETPPTTPTDEERWPRSAKEWKAFKEARAAQIKEKEKEISTIRAQLDDYKKKAETKVEVPPEFETIKKERDELSERLRVADIVNHPRFKAYFDNKTNAQMELAKRIVGTELSERAVRLLSLPDSDYRKEQLESFVAELSPFDQSRLGGVVNALNEISLEKQAEIEKATKDYQAIKSREESERKTTQEKAQEAARKAYQTAVSKAQDEKDGLFVYQLKENDAEWNKGVQERLAGVEKLLSTPPDRINPEQVATIALWATALPEVLKSHYSVLKENEQLKSQIAGMTKATPKAVTRTATDTRGTNAPVTPEKRGYGANPMEVTAEWMKVINQQPEE